MAFGANRRQIGLQYVTVAYPLGSIITVDGNLAEEFAKSRDGLMPERFSQNLSNKANNRMERRKLLKQFGTVACSGIT